MTYMFFFPLFICYYYLLWIKSMGGENRKLVNKIDHVHGSWASVVVANIIKLVFTHSIQKIACMYNRFSTLSSPVPLIPFALG